MVCSFPRSPNEDFPSTTIWDLSTEASLLKMAYACKGCVPPLNYWLSEVEVSMLWIFETTVQAKGATSLPSQTHSLFQILSPEPWPKTLPESTAYEFFFLLLFCKANLEFQNPTFSLFPVAYSQSANCPWWVPEFRAAPWPAILLPVLLTPLLPWLSHLPVWLEKK